MEIQPTFQFFARPASQQYNRSCQTFEFISISIPSSSVYHPAQAAAYSTKGPNALANSFKSVLVFLVFTWLNKSNPPNKEFQIYLDSAKNLEASPNCGTLRDRCLAGSLNYQNNLAASLNRGNLRD